MKIEDYQNFCNAVAAVEKFYEESETSLVDENFETWTEINDWNERFVEAMMELQNLKEEIIYTFKLTD